MTPTGANNKTFWIPQVKLDQSCFLSAVISAQRQRGLSAFYCSQLPIFNGGRGWKGFAEMVPEPQEEKKGKGWEAAL